jgi:hypothetical protein
MVKGGGIFSTGRCLYKQRRDWRSGRAPGVGDGRWRRVRLVNRWHMLCSPAPGGRCVGFGLVFESGASHFGLTSTL